MKQTGYLILADISGYTAFVAQTEIDHGARILEGLTKTVVDELRQPLHVQEIEGDAVFAYAHTDDFDRGVVLVEVLEAVYAAFRSALDNIAQCSTCTCQACGRATDLDLKFIVHHGAFVPRRVGAHSGIGGPDVIVAHRLLKNGIRQRHGLASYAFLTAPAVERMGVEQLAQAMTPHDETYEHLGRIDGFVYDLGDYWERLKASRNIVVSQDGAYLAVSEELAAPVSLAWEYYTNPRHRQVWLQSEDLSSDTGANGRYGTGTIEHCVHGKETTVFTTLDWKPMRYVTQAFSLPFGGRMLCTASFESVDGGTRVAVVFSQPRNEQLLKRVLLRSMIQLMGNSLRADLSRCTGLYYTMVRERAALVAGDAAMTAVEA